MVPWTPSNHWEGPPIASLQSNTGKGGSPDVLSRYPQRHPSLRAARQRIHSRSVALPSSASFWPSAPLSTLENCGNRFWATEIDHLLHENFGQWYDFPSGWEPSTLPGFLWSSAFVWKINWWIRSPSLPDLPRIHLFVTSFRNESAEAVVTRHFAWESLPKLSKTKEVRKTLTVFSNSTESQSTWCTNIYCSLLLIHVKHIINKYRDHIQPFTVLLAFGLLIKVQIQMFLEYICIYVYI